MKLITFLLLLLDMGKAEGNLKDAMLWLKKVVDDIRASLPDEAADYISPTIDKLYTELGGQVDRLSIRLVVEEFVGAFSGTTLGPPDDRAGLGV